MILFPLLLNRALFVTSGKIHLHEPVASPSSVEEFQKRMMAELLFVTVVCEDPPEPDGRDLIILHMFVVATELPLTPVFLNRGVPALKLP